ncbi:MAG: urease accessory protein UreE [Thioalkalispiraceae bacterium]|jgi:urease accessory protein
MIKATELLTSYENDAELSLTLPFELRQKSRFKAMLDNGDEIGLILPRGTILRGGDFLRAEDGSVIVIRAAEETVSTATINDQHLFARACYHLGNRHVPLQIGENWLRYLHDHVLDDMLAGLGITVTCEQASFEPEPGAYGGHSHQHHH